VTEAAWQQRGNGGRAEAVVVVAAATQQAESSGAAGQQDIGNGGGGRVVGAEAAWQRQHLHEGSGSSAEAAAGQQGGGGSRVVFMAERRRQSGGRAAEQWSQCGRGPPSALGGGCGRTAAAERGKWRQRSKTVGRQDGGSEGVSEWGTIEGVNGDVWVRRKRLGADGGGGGGRRSKAVGEGLLFFRMEHVLGIQGQEVRCFLKVFFV
jgi:hypothetical protein